jgi:hypothetical protein
MGFFKNDKTNLHDFLTAPSLPWENRIVISAAGVIASGWTLNNKVFLFSSDGYSVSDPMTGEQDIRNYDEDNSAIKKFSEDNLEFTIDEIQQKIKVFGLRGGDGNHCTTDYWDLTSFSPALGEQIIGIGNMKSRQSTYLNWQGYELISLERLEYTSLKFGFSPNEKHFGIFGSAGAEIFTRE